MLQQTQVRTAIPYYLRFIARLPTLEALAAAREEEVLALWAGLGYYARARNLHAAAREALRLHGGLPASLEALRALPGFGPYTAGAVASIAFAIPAAAVDGNVARVLARVFLVPGDAGRSPSSGRLATLADELVGAPAARAGPARRADGPRDGRPGDLNQALMELGATTCGKPAPACCRCPLPPLCAARAAGREREVPAPRCRPGRRPLVMACAVVRQGEATLFARRPAHGLFGGLLALPAVEVAPGADPRAALARALVREHGLRVRVGDEVATCERPLTHRALTLRAYACEVRGAIVPSRRLRFATPRALARSGAPAAMLYLLARIPREGSVDHRPDPIARFGLTGRVASV
jgi:A/G-specific adenine glycosylase